MSSSRVPEYPYVWFWRQKTEWRIKVEDGVIVELSAPRVFDRDRKGERCRVLVRSLSMHSALIEFEDGYRVVTSRGGLRRGSATDGDPRSSREGRKVGSAERGTSHCALASASSVALPRHKTRGSA